MSGLCPGCSGPCHELADPYSKQPRCCNCTVGILYRHCHQCERTRERRLEETVEAQKKEIQELKEKVKTLEEENEKMKKERKSLEKDKEKQSMRDSLREDFVEYNIPWDKMGEEKGAFI